MGPHDVTSLVAALMALRSDTLWDNSTLNALAAVSSGGTVVGGGVVVVGVVVDVVLVAVLAPVVAPAVCTGLLLPVNTRTRATASASTHTAPTITAMSVLLRSRETALLETSGTSAERGTEGTPLGGV